MAPVMQYVFAKMLVISEYFAAGSHEWLPYSAIPPFPKQIYKLQFITPLRKTDKHISVFYGNSFAVSGH